MEKTISLRLSRELLDKVRKEIEGRSSISEHIRGLLVRDLRQPDVNHQPKNRVCTASQSVPVLVREPLRSS
jgi:Arc/MetJ-type ribon-helix-helix transcriptional regulator